MPAGVNSKFSSRERVRLALAHKETDRIPVSMICSGINQPAYDEFAKYLKGKTGRDIKEFLDATLDIRHVFPKYVGPPRKEGEDIWGVRREAVSYGAASYSEISYYPLGEAETVADLEKHCWPTTEWFDYSSVPALIAEACKDCDYSIIGPGGNIFETTWYMRGFEKIFMDMVLNPELVHGIMEKVTTYYIEAVRKMLAAAKGKMELSFTADDIAGQSGLLMSLEMWEEFIKPCHVRLNKAIHEFGVKVIYHSDGAVMDAVPGLIDMGIDVLQALQFDADGMDPKILKDKYGDRLCFEGGVSVQKTLPFGTPEDVRKEVRHLKKTLGKNGGYILGPAHAIQAGTPPENIYAMFEAAAN